MDRRPQKEWGIIVFSVLFKLFKQASHYLEDNSDISLNVQSVYLLHLFSNFQIICSRGKVRYTFYLFGGKTEEMKCPSESTNGLKVFISSLVGWHSTLALLPLSLLRLVRFNFCLLFSGPRVASERGFLCFPKNLSFISKQGRTSGSLWKMLLFVFGSLEGDDGFENTLTIVVMFT